MSMMESVLSLDDGRWPHPADMSTPPLITEVREDPFPLVKQPSPPPVLAKVQQEYATIPPSKVADPRPGVAKQSQDESESFQRLHIVGLIFLFLFFILFLLYNFRMQLIFNCFLLLCSDSFCNVYAANMFTFQYDIGYFYLLLQPVKMLDDFLRLARENTNKNLETCGVLAGSLVRAN